MEPGGVGVKAFVDPTATAPYLAQVTVTGDTSITGAATGVLVQGVTASAQVLNNAGSIYGNAIGIDVAGGSATISGNHIYNNTTGILVEGGSASIDANDFEGGASADNGTDIRLTGGTVTGGTLTGNTFAGTTYIDVQTAQNLTALRTGDSANAYNGAADDFDIEDRIVHKMDDPAKSLGLVTWVDGKLFVTDAGTDHSIQRAVDIADDAWTVNVEAGLYSENVVVDKGLVLDGQDRATTIIDAAQPGAAGIGIHLSNTSGATLRDFTIRNAADGVDIANVEAYAYGVLVSNSHDNVIENLTITDPGLYGIFLWDNADDNTVRNNSIDGTHAGGVGTGYDEALDGIFSSGGSVDEGGHGETNDGNIIQGNTISNVVFGVSLVASNGTQVLDNGIHASDSAYWGGAGYLSYGVNVFASSHTLIGVDDLGAAHANTIDSSQLGVRVRNAVGQNYEYAGLPTGNVIENNSITSSLRGVMVYGGVDTTIQNNTNAGASEAGVLLTPYAGTATTGTTVSGNTFSGNATDLRIDAGVTGTTIGNASTPDTRNTFAGSTYFIDNRASQSFDLTAYDAANLGGLTDNFRIEDKMHHRMDTDLPLATGLITWHADNVYVTDPLHAPLPSTDSSIQRGIDIADSGWTVNVEAGIYHEQLTIAKPITVTGQDGAVLDGSGLTPEWTTGVKIRSGNVTFNNIDVTNYTQDGITAYRKIDMPNIHITNLKVSNIQPGYWGFGIYVGYESEAWDYAPPGNLTQFLDFSGLLIENNEIVNTACSGIVLQAIAGTNLVVQNNYIHGITANDAIWIDGARNLTIQNNVIDGNKWGIDITSIGDGYPSTFTQDGPHGPQNILIQSNYITNNVEQGIAVYDGWTSTMTITENYIVGNGTGLQNFLSGPVNAAGNWWGDANGPNTAANTYAYGFRTPLGDAVVGPVTVAPWLTDGTDDPDAPGFQPKAGEPDTSVPGLTVSDQTADEGTSKLFNVGTLADIFSFGNSWQVKVTWGDATPDTDFEATATGSLPQQSHTYADNGTYTATVRVTDHSGNMYQDSFDVVVGNVDPVIDSLSASSVDENGTVTLSGTYHDVGTQDTHTLTINWGEGLAETVAVTGGTFSVTHQYLDDNPTGTPSDVYTINVTLTDDDTGAATSSTTTTISNLPPVIDSLSASSANENGIVTLTGTYHDVGTQDTHTLTINWGEGLAETVAVTGGAFSVTRQYLDDNPTGTPSDVYTINVTLTDDDTGAATSSTTTTISNLPPVIDSLSASSANENGIVILTGTYHDVGTQDTHTLTINWGEGLAETVAVTGGTFSVTHQYKDDNPTGTASDVYTINVTLTDDDTGSATSSTTTTISNLPPVIDSLSATSVSENGIVTLTGTYHDVGTQDTHTLTINWGEGLAETVAVTGGAFSVTHQYKDDNPTGTASDVYTINVTLTDDDTGAATSSTTTTISNLPPVIDSLSASSANENGVVTLTGTYHDVGTQDTHTLTINWGEGLAETVAVTGGAFSVTHQYKDDNPTGTASDVYTINVTLTDDDTGAATSSTTTTISNLPPVIDSLSATSVSENGIVTLTGTYHDVGTQDTHALTINWGEGLAETVAVTGGAFSVTHQYKDDNPTGTPSDVYTINVTLTDDDTGAATSSTTTTISNLPPVIDSLSASSANENGIVILTGTYHDVGTQDTHTLTINWGEGLAETVAVTGGAFSVTHQYLDDNPTGTASDVYTINVTLTDDDTGAATSSTTTTISNLPPVIDSLSATSVSENGVVTLTGTYHDVGTQDTHTLTINWGEGLAETVAVTGGAFSVTHQYKDDNPTGTASDVYTINVTLTDDDTGAATSSTTTTISNLPPVIDSLSATSVSENGFVTLTGTYHDVGTQDTHALTINWGEGLAETVAVTGGAFSVTHQYKDDNPTGTASDVYTINVTLTDDDTGAATSSTTTTISNLPPVIDSLSATSVDENGTVTLSGTYHDTGTQDTHTLTINWGEGLAETVAVAGGAFSVTHQYKDDNPTGTASDVYTINVTLTDDDTGTATSSTTTTISNLPPVIDSLSATSVSENGFVTLTGTYHDVGTQDTHTLTINWGEGLAQTVAVTGGAFSVTHQYLDDNPTGTASDVYAINVTLTDDDGGTDAAATESTVTNVNPTLPVVNFSATTINENDEVTVSGTVGDVGSLDTHTVRIVWGDGDVSAPVAVNPTTRQFTATHRYLDDNPTATAWDNYTIAVTATDDDGGVSAAVTQVITVNNVAPTSVTITAPATSSEGISITATAAVVDPGTADTFTYAWTVTKNSVLYASQTGSSSSFTFTPDDGPSTFKVSLTVTDDDGGVKTATPVSIGITDVAPTIALSGLAEIDENSTYTLTLGPIAPAGETVRDPISRVRVIWGDGLDDTILDVAHGNAAELAILNAGGSISLQQHYADGPGIPAVSQIVVALTNDGGLFPLAGVMPFHVNNLDPSGSFTNGGAVVAGENGWVEWFNVNDPSPVDDASLRYAYDFNNDGIWDLGSDIYGAAVPQDTAVVPGAYLIPDPGTGLATVKSRVIDKDGGFFETTTQIVITPTTFRVTSLAANVSGFDVQFNRAVDLTTLNLYDGYNHELGSPDMTVIGAHAGRDYYGNVIPGAVAGSLIWDAASNTAHFVKTGGALAADSYTVTLFSRTGGWVDTAGRLLDGDSNGTDGGNYVYTFTVGTSTARVLSVPDFARGPRQPVNVDSHGTALGTNLPVFISDASNIYSVDFTLTYDPSLLTITVPAGGNIALGAGMPASGWSATANFVDAGQLKVTVSGTTPLPSGTLNQNLVSLVASVPENAPYLAAEILRFTNIRVNENQPGFAAVGDSAIHKVAFLGDATGEGVLGGTDASRISRAVVGRDGGFSAYPLTDPVIVADATGDGTLSGLDSSYVGRKSVGQSVPTIPDVPYYLDEDGLPVPYPVTVFAGLDPTVQIGNVGALADPGDTVHAIVRITDNPQGLNSANFTISYDTRLLDLANADVTLGNSLAGKGWSLIKNVTGSGVVYVSMYGSPLTEGTPELLDLAFHVRTDAGGGTSPLSISGTLNDGRLTMTPVNGSIIVAAAAPAPEPSAPTVAAFSVAAVDSVVAELGSVAQPLPVVTSAPAVPSPGVDPQAVDLNILAAAMALQDAESGRAVAAADSLLSSGLPGKRASGLVAAWDYALTDMYGAGGN